MSQHPRVAVIGAGVGGLSAAIDLARGGARVTVYEANDAPGGKMRRVTVAGRRFDAGPTVFTMRWVFERLFADGGQALEDALTLRPAERLARHAWTDGSRLDLFADAGRTEAALSDFAGPEAAAQWRAFCAHAATIYAEVEGPFIEGRKPTVRSLVAARGLGLFGALKRIDSWRTLWSALTRHFTDPRLRQLFARYATYSGSSPFLAPATLSLIAHVEAEGVWLVDGGMHRLAQALVDLARAQGVEIHFGARVRAITGEDRVEGVVVDAGEAAADAVVLNAGAGTLAAGHLGPAAARAVSAAPPRSLSAWTRCVVGRVEGFPLAFHNVFFSSDYAREFTEIFDAGRVPTEPTVYICAQDRDGFCPEPDGDERLFVLINAPPHGDTQTAADEIDRARRSSEKLLARCGLSLRSTAESATGPTHFEALFPGTGGGLYGPPSHGWRAALRRPGVRTRMPGLYLAGGEVHPGAGVPMAALSGRLAARLFFEDLR